MLQKLMYELFYEWFGLASVGKDYKKIMPTP
jgi:hypothetical protein